MLELHLTKPLHTAQGPATFDVRLSVPPSALLAVYGPSGAGKTTLLRLLAGLDRPTSGYLRVAGETWSDHARGLWLPPQRRSVGFVFQDYALFPNMTVRENLEFALPNQQNSSLVAELLDMVGLSELAGRRPAALSGGQQQRVALARALARQPKLLLLDEPLAALDAPTRLRLQDALAAAHHRFQLTTLLVSHDDAEIRRLATHVVALDQGQIVRQGPPAVVLPAPVAAFQLTGTVVAVQPQGAGLVLKVDVGGPVIDVAVPTAAYRVGDQLTLSATADRVEVLQGAG